jgi:hypothetical protein
MAGGLRAAYRALVILTEFQPEREANIMKPLNTTDDMGGEAPAPHFISAVNFCRSPLGRVVLHLECLCHHPAAARFYCGGFRRNLGELAQSLPKSVRKFWSRLRRGAGTIHGTS